MLGSSIELESKEEGLLVVVESWDIGRAVDPVIVSAGDLLTAEAFPSTGSSNDLFLNPYHDPTRQLKLVQEVQGKIPPAGLLTEEQASVLEH